MAKFDLLDLYKRTFGYVAKFSPSINLDAVVPVGSQYADSGVTVPSGYKESLLGTPIFSPLTLDDFEFPDEPIIQVSGSKRIVETEFDGNDGAFLELFTLNNYEVEISGILVSENDDEYPEELVRKVRSIYEKRKSVKAVNSLLSIYNISQLAILSCDFRIVPGEYGMQAFTLKCKSDKTFQLELKKGGVA